MSDSPAWVELANDSDSGVRVVTVEAETHEPLGQELLADPLSALFGLGVLVSEPDRYWKVQLQVVNADIPSGPLPLPDEIDPTSDSSWVIRKHKDCILIFDQLDLVVVVVYRYATDRTTALEVLQQSLAARQNQA